MNTTTIETPTKIIDGKSYIDSLRGRDLKIYLFGEKVEGKRKFDYNRNPEDQK